MSWRAIAPAKVNLSLLVSALDGSGLHPVRSLAYTIDWLDILEARSSEEDQLEVGSAEVPAGRENLVWAAVEAARAAGADVDPLAFRLDKHIPAAAGLGGGSADAAAALVILETMLDGVRAAELAATVGADVPLCLQGGLAEVRGYGETVTSAGPTPTDHSLAIVVPPFDLPTAGVYQEWDRLDGPAGVEVSSSSLPPSLRSHAPVRNDLYPAAVAQTNELEDWRTALVSLWARPVLMTGSGPSLFGFFLDAEEAESALEVVPPGARDTQVAAPYGQGAHLDSR